jgi:hypothetical protein
VRDETSQRPNVVLPEMFAEFFGSDWALRITFQESWPRHAISCCGFLNHAVAEPPAYFCAGHSP